MTAPPEIKFWRKLETGDDVWAMSRLSINFEPLRIPRSA